MYFVQVTDKNAIYVNDTRITNRSTKWGVHTIIDSWQTDDKENIVEECKNRGHNKPASLIDWMV